MALYKGEFVTARMVVERLVEAEELLRDEIVGAYQQGAMDVHENHQPDRAPDFSEAAHDYAASRIHVHLKREAKP
jgi:hypothetical protein